MGDGSKNQFALTSSEGNAIGYLLPEHIALDLSADEGENWTVLNTPADYTFTAQGTQVVLTTAPVVGAWLRIKRNTPLDKNWVDYQSGNLLTAGQLNEFESWQLYIDQELKDAQDHMTGQVFPGVDGLITEEEAEKDPENPKWEGDSKLPTVGAAERVYSNLVGKGTDYPGAATRASTASSGLTMTALSLTCSFGTEMQRHRHGSR